MTMYLVVVENNDGEKKARIFPNLEKSLEFMEGVLNIKSEIGLKNVEMFRMTRVLDKQSIDKLSKELKVIT